MSDAQKQVVVQLRKVCGISFAKQLSFIAAAERVSSQLKEQTVMLFIHAQRIERMDSFPTLSPEQESELTDFSAEVEAATDTTELQQVERKLTDWMQGVHAENLTPASISMDVLTDNQLNRRMIDLLFVMKDKIRATRRRLNDAGGGYDKDAYVAARNRANLAQAVYIDQLHRDIVSATNEDAAELEQNRYGAIEDATAATFVGAIEDLVSFMQARILAPFA